MKLTLKSLLVPFSNLWKTVEAVQCWEVRWTSRHGEYNFDVRPEVEVFASSAEAEEFATSLRNAFELIRHTWGDDVTVRKAK